MEDKPISKFMVPFSGRLYLEAANAEEASIKVHEWRQFAVRCHHNKLEELNLQKIVIERIPEILEVDEETPMKHYARSSRRSGIIQRIELLLAPILK